MKEFIEKLIGRFEEVSIPIFDKDTEMESKVIFADIAKNIVNELAEEYKGGWIPVSERLPNEEEMKRAYCRNRYGSEFIVMIEGATQPTTLYRTLDGFWVDDHRNIYKVTAWQPLPEPYKEETDGRVRG